MAFDTSIFSRYKSNIESPLNALMRGLEIRRAEQGNALQQIQVQQAQQQARAQQQESALRQRFAIPENRPGDGVGPTQEAGYDFGGYANALAGVDPMRALQMKVALQKETPSGVVVGDGGALVDPRTGRMMYENQRTAKAAELSPLARLITERDSLPAGHPSRPLYEAQIRKLNTHQPAASIVNYGAPVPVQLPDGTVGYVQPSNRGGPVSPMSDAGGKPMVKPTDQRDKDLTEAAAKATTYLGQMRSATSVLKGIGADQSALSLQAETALAGGAANIVIREKAQRVRQAQDQWSEAFLRVKTGAASTPAEVAANRKTFFPVLGDKPETIQQKAEMRLQAERDLEIPAGRGAKQLTEPPSGAPAKPAAGGWKIERVN